MGSPKASGGYKTTREIPEVLNQSEKRSNLSGSKIVEKIGKDLKKRRPNLHRTLTLGVG